MKHPALILTLSAATFALAACTGSSPTGAVEVASTAEACTVSTDSVESGSHTFAITNEGEQVTEFYILGADGLQIVTERENIAPGDTVELAVSLAPGDYYTACKPGLRGANVGQAAFTVTGDPIPVDTSEQERYGQVVTSYVDFVRAEVDALVPEVNEFADAYAAGDDEAARARYATARVHYERIEPLAEALGPLDPRIDFREVDYLAEAELLKQDDPTFDQWLGFHRMEKDLWPPTEDERNADGAPAREGWTESTPQQRQVVAETLKADVAALRETVNDEKFIADQGINVSTVSNGAIGLLEEVAKSKVTGEEDWWSHTDLWDFQANVQGARAAFDLVAPIAQDKGAEGQELVEGITTQFEEMQTLLDEYGSLEEGFVLYDQVDAGQQAELTRQLDALREPLARLTGTVLGIEA
ncbi:iron uptake system protein EfeO [Corynebacterium guangdongense]|uniref:Iron uptake system component EfeO n=1 Tax=Corynebacterium guangdongense TaxID=1783348 RepID=A0ABU1ZUK7_9CORY|nr:iron uptake system protein EfeO [Corynebacterium guangdongense]MDR7328616.1 iron uptake system component EfeO [Corynebacterium guangdongense]WJZ17193.1 Iron uptake system component EfeO precursor [Corynebacterium guangdongense]